MVEVTLMRRRDRRLGRSMKPPKPPKHPYLRLTLQAETWVRMYLDNLTGGVMPERILGSRAGARWECRELDVVLRGYGCAPRAFLEVKTSLNRPGTTARRQLSRSLELARLRWPRATGAIVWVDTSCLVQEKARPTFDIDSVFASLDEALEAPGLSILRVDLRTLLFWVHEHQAPPDLWPSLARARSALQLAQAYPTGTA